MSQVDLNPKPKFEDPLIDEIRRIRRELSDRFGIDAEKLGAYAREVSERCQRKYGLKKANLHMQNGRP